jgi:AcrR family transcriptional regulator
MQPPEPADTPNPPMEEALPLRRAPSQRRSRERVERILSAATELIEHGGSDALRMSEIASRAGVSIGSLYQYFPDKSAVVRALAKRYNARGRGCVAAELTAAADEAELWSALARLTDEYYQMFLSEPVMRDIWAGTQADPSLREIDLADVRENGALLACTLSRLRPGADPEEIATSSLLVMHLIAATVRLAISTDREEGEALIRECKRLLFAPGPPFRT